MAENTNADSGNVENMESPPMTTAKPAPLQKQLGEVNIEVLLAKNRSEIMYELRKMKHEKPVTKTKENTKKLLEKVALQKDARVTRSGGKKKKKLAKKFEQSAVELSRQESDSFKPEEVLQEVRGLLEQQRVTEFLQNEIERQHLEQVLMETIERRQNEQQRRSQRRHVRFANNESAAAVPRATISRNSAPSYDQGRQQHHRMPHRDQTQIISQLRTSPALNRMDPEQRDELISEISNLVQRRLVTTTLSGELRGVLELHIQERADRVSSGQGVDSVMQSLQRRNTYHRETHHGRDSQQDQETYSGLRSDIEQMKNQLRDMKQMMRISFDLQMDIQRAIRQEVAAAMVAACNMQTAHIQTAGFTPPPPASVNTGAIAGQPTPPISSGQCIICLQRQIDSVIYRCGHMCVCITCGLELKGQNLKCPVCRAPITDIIRAYTSC